MSRTNAQKIPIAPGEAAAALLLTSAWGRRPERSVALLIPFSSVWLRVDRKTVVHIALDEPRLLESSQWQVRLLPDGRAQIKDNYSSMYAAVVRAKTGLELDDRVLQPRERPTREILLHSNASGAEEATVLTLEYGDTIIHEYAVWRFVTLAEL